MSGENPVYLGSSESWMLRVPYLGASKTSAGSQVRQLLATMMSGAASASAALKASSGLFAT